MTQYASLDAIGILCACLLFPLLAFFPGYLAGHLSNVWQFRRRCFTFQVAASVPLSLGLGPIFTFLLGTLANWWFVWSVYLAASVWSLVLLIRSRPKLDRYTRGAIGVGLLWAGFAGVWLMDWDWNGRLYFPIYGLDYATRAAFVHSLAAFGLPARSPFFNTGPLVPLHYHYLWLLQCALIHAVAPLLISARLAMIAGTIWCGLGFMCLCALAMRILFQLHSWKVIALLSLTGLDILPALVILWGNRVHLLGTLPPSVEWWNQQVDGWVYTALWQPHYLCALIACATAFLSLWKSRQRSCVVVAAPCLATAFGAGMFVAVVFAAFLCIWIVLHLRQSARFVWAAAIALLLLLPYLKALQGPSRNASGAWLLAPTIRAFSPVALPSWANLLALPLNYFLEFGFFGACLWVGYRGRKLTQTERILLLMVIVSVILCTFVKSNATPNNDFGWRGMLVAQFALLLLAAQYLHRCRVSTVMKLLVLLGMTGTVYDLLLTRFYPILSDVGQAPRLKWLAVDQQLGDRTRANREAYTWLAHHSAATAIVAQNPNVEAVNIFSGLYGDRNIVAGDRTCTTGFGGSDVDCKPVYQSALAAFAGRTDFSEACSGTRADFLVARPDDAVFQQRRPWVFANQYVRIFKCGGSNRTNEP